MGGATVNRHTVPGAAIQISGELPAGPTELLVEYYQPFRVGVNVGDHFFSDVHPHCHQSPVTPNLEWDRNADSSNMKSAIQT
jgi:hypothetical protein